MTSIPADITKNAKWRHRQTTRLLGYEVARKAIEARNGKIAAGDIADLTASDHREAGRVLSYKFLPRLLTALGKPPTRENIKAIRKFFNESKY